MSQAWKNDQRVKTLKVVIQVINYTLIVSQSRLKALLSFYYISVVNY